MIYSRYALLTIAQLDNPFETQCLTSPTWYRRRSSSLTLLCLLPVLLPIEDLLKLPSFDTNSDFQILNPPSRKSPRSLRFPLTIVHELQQEKLQLRRSGTGPKGT